MSTFLRILLAICIATFAFGGSAISKLESSTSELSRQDSAGVAEADASPWLRRSSSRAETVAELRAESGDVPGGLNQDDFVLPDPPVEEVTIVRGVDSDVALVKQSRPAAPVRGPPCA